MLSKCFFGKEIKKIRTQTFDCHRNFEKKIETLFPGRTIQSHLYTHFTGFVRFGGGANLSVVVREETEERGREKARER